MSLDNSTHDLSRQAQVEASLMQDWRWRWGQELMHWSDMNDLPWQSADDMILDPKLAPDQREWLSQFIIDWEHAERISQHGLGDRVVPLRRENLPREENRYVDTYGPRPKGIVYL